MLRPWRFDVLAGQLVTEPGLGLGPGVDFYSRRIDRARRTTHLLRQLHALGYQVQLTDTAA